MMLIMKKKRYRTPKSFGTIKLDRVFTSLIAIFLLGTLVGAVLSASANNEAFDYIRKIALSYISLRSSQSEKAIFLSIFTPNAAMLLFVLTCRSLKWAVPILWVVPLLQGLGFGLYAVNMLKNAEKYAVKIFTFTAFQEKFWTILVLLAVCTAIIKTDALHHRGIGLSNKRPLNGSYAAIVILSMLFMALASAVSTFIVFRFGCPLLRML